tara:strand:+ start:1369 stop:1959 length:591 start_codon:yes stop_codon:yes gene_type:complete
MTSKALFNYIIVKFIRDKFVIAMALAVVMCGMSIYSLYAQNEGAPQMNLLDFQLTDLNGETINTKDLEGKVVVFDFWATWCAPCIKSFPAMIEVQHSFKENKEVLFLFVNTLEIEGRDGDFIARFLDKKGIDLMVYLDRAKPGSEPLSERLGISSLPYKIIVDKSGEIRYMDSGFSGGSEDFKNELNDKINSLLDS